MGKLKKGQRIVCVPCGRETIITNAGISERTIWCCGRPMSKKTKAAAKKIKAKHSRKKKK